MRLYNMTSDPAEEWDLARTRPESVRVLLGRLREYYLAMDARLLGVRNKLVGKENNYNSSIEKILLF